MGTSLLVLVLLVGGLGLSVIVFGLLGRGIPRQRHLTEELFENQLQNHPHLATARLVRQKDEVNSDSAVDVLTNRIYQCEDGFYWLFICATGQPGYVTQLNPERAKNALRSTPEILAKEFPGEA